MRKTATLITTRFSPTTRPWTAGASPAGWSSPELPTLWPCSAPGTGTASRTPATVMKRRKKPGRQQGSTALTFRSDFFFFTNFYFCQYFVVLQADLVNIQSEEENEFISKFYSGQPGQTGDEYWIGLRRNETDPDSFVWTDGTVLTYSKWASGQPDDAWQGQECGVKGYRKLTLWDDQSCATRLSFVCEKRPN